VLDTLCKSLFLFSHSTKHLFIYTIALHSVFYKTQNVRGPFDKFVDWRQCVAVMQREAVTVMPSCSGGGNVVMA